MSANRIRWCLLFALHFSVSGCGPRLPAPTNSPPTPPVANASQAPAPVEYKAAVVSTGYFELWHLGGEIPTSQESALLVWRELLPRMAKDDKTRELLQKLHGQLPVELHAVAKDAFEDHAPMMGPPNDEFAVAIRLADYGLGEMKLVGGEKVPSRSLAYAHVVLIRNATSAAGGELGVVGPPNGMPSPFEPIKLAMEEYVLRHAPGWLLSNGEHSQGAKIPESVEAQRRDLDARIKTYSDYANTFYDKRRPKP